MIFSIKASKPILIQKIFVGIMAIFLSSCSLQGNESTLDSTFRPGLGNQNATPLATNTAISVVKNVVKTGILSATDANPNDTLTYSLVTQGTLGIVAMTNAITGAFTYTPNNNVIGSDSFTFKVNDGKIDSNTATVTVTIYDPSTPPVATAITPTAFNEDTQSGLITLSYSDIDADLATTCTISNLTNVIVTQACACDVSGVCTLKVTGTANSNGAASFGYKVTANGQDSNITTATLSIVAVNDVPIASTGTLTTNEDTTGIGILVATDVEGSTLTYTVVANGTHGTVTITNAAAGAYSYVPVANYNGTDSFTFKANDGLTDSNTATINVTVTSVNDAPIATSQSPTVSYKIGSALTLAATDADGNLLTYAIVSGPAHGALSGTAPNLTYTPTLGYAGSDSFTFKVNDGTVDSTVATVSITIPIPAAPSSLSYSSPTAIYVYNHTSSLLTNDIANNTPTVTNAVDTYSINPNLTTNTGLDFDTSTGVISGKPNQTSSVTTYTITATNVSGSTTTTISIRTGPGFLVNSLADTGNDASTVNDCDTDPGVAKICTLRAAIEQINTWLGFFIVIIPSGTITLTSTITLQTQMEIIGASQTTTILTGGNQAVKFFDVTAFGLTITDLTMTNATNKAITVGVTGGLTLKRITMSYFTSGTTGGAISTNGSLDISESRFESNTGTQGGAIYVSGGASLTVDATYFLSNRATIAGTCGTGNGGGAIAIASGGLDLSKSLFELNSATSCGGALSLKSGGTKNIVDTTFSGNTASGASAIYTMTGFSYCINCTIAGNSDSGGSYGPVRRNSGTMAFYSTIIAGNWISAGTVPKNCSGTMDDQGNNISDLADCGLASGNNTDPKINPLANNGGYTKTFSLQVGSPAIDSGNNGFCGTNDQRGPGFNRIVNGTCDIGAFEKQ